MTTNTKWPYRLLTPGPVPLHPKVREILSAEMIHHRTPEFEKCLAAVNLKLKDLFSTSQPVFMHVSTGSGAMESSIVNTLSPGDPVLCIVSGKFGERWAQMAATFGCRVSRMDIPWGEAVDPKKVAQFLSENPGTRAVFTQACETSTATVHPIRELAEIVRARAETILIVDAITAVGAMDLEMDQWGVDVVIGGSQKAFMLPTGLSFIALSEKAWKFCETAKMPRFYWDLRSEKKSLASGETHFSASVPLVRALDVALTSLTGAEKKRTLMRIQSLARGTRDAAVAMGLQIFSLAPSPSVTAISLPSSIDGQKLRAHIEKNYQITVMGGQDQLKGKILRVGHLGYILDSDMLAFFEALSLSLNEMGFVVSPEKLQAAQKAFLAAVK